MEKVIRNGKVAVLYSPGYGAGFSTYGAPKELVFDPQLVALVEAGKQSEIEAHLKSRGFDFYIGGTDTLKIEWVTQGSLFKIDVYDGSESICIVDSNPEFQIA